MGDVTYIDPKRNNMTSVTENVSDVLHCLMITLSDETIILPNTAVAEVIAFTKPEPIEGSPSWFLGRISWRERRVPLISFGMASSAADSELERKKGDRIAILNTMNGDANIPYIGIVSQGIPRLNVLHSKDISTIQSNPDDRLSVLEIVNLDGMTLVVPDIDDLEKRLKEIHT